MSLLINSTRKIFDRDLSVLEKEISLYQSEEAIWRIQKEVKNSAGNLCLHLCGNLQYYIGTVLGNLGYIRNRELEFSAKNISKEKLIHEIQVTKTTVTATLDRLNANLLEEIYPVEVFKEPMTTGHFLIHLTAHLGYHLGQINYHRRLI
jgi:uncharacterized damage-inducible protein DinB